MTCQGKQINTAYTTKGTLISVDDIVTNNQVYICGICGNNLAIRNSKYQIKHFYHLKDKQKKLPDFSLHQSLQKRFYLILCNQGFAVSWEKPITKQLRADLYVYKEGKAFVIEIQRTNIIKAELLKRINFYKIAKIPLVWIIPVQKQKLTGMLLHAPKWEQYLFAYNQKVLLYILEDDRLLELIDLIKVSNTTMHITTRMITIGEYLNKIQESELWGRCSLETKEAFKFYQKKWLINYHRQYKKSDILNCHLYKYQVNLDNVSPQIFYPLQIFNRFALNIFSMQLLIYLLYRFGKKSTEMIAGLLISEQLVLIEKHSDVVSAVQTYYFYLTKKGLIS